MGAAGPGIVLAEVAGSVHRHLEDSDIGSGESAVGHIQSQSMLGPEAHCFGTLP